MSITEKNVGPTWVWLAGILLALFISVMSYNGQAVAGDVETMKSYGIPTIAADVTELKAASFKRELRIQANEAQYKTLEEKIKALDEKIEREHRLLVKIANRMGIEVAQ